MDQRTPITSTIHRHKQHHEVARTYRVLHLVHSQQRRGAEVFATQLASCIEEAGRFKNGLCSLYSDEDDRPVGGLPIIRLQGQSGVFNKLAINPQLVARLCRVLGQFKPDVLVAHGSDTLKYAGSASLFYRKGRIIYRNIGIASDWANSSLKVNLNRLFLRRMSAVVSVSEFTRQDFINVYHVPQRRVICIPNGVDVTQFCASDKSLHRAQVRLELGIDREALALVSVGNLSPEKGHAGLLPVVRGLIDAGLVGHLLLLGDGPLHEALAAQAQELGIAERVRFLGRRNDVARVLAAADVFVLPSKTEGMPAVLIEAGLSGLPAVAFDVGGVGEVIEHQKTGLLAAPGEYRDMKSKLAPLCRDAQRRAAMGEAARRRCHELFSMQKVASEYEALFLKMVQDPSRGMNGKA